MPLDTAKGPNYLKVSKLFIDSADKEPGSLSEYDYVINLADEIQYVVAMEVTGYNFPSEIAPTFVNASDRSPGNNAIDFTLTNGIITTTFTTVFPQKSYTYENVSVPYLSYIRTLQQLLNETIYTDPDFGNGGANQATFTVTSDPFEKTKLSVSGTGVTGFSFLFGTGANATNSAAEPMGFTPGVDTGPALSLVSPGVTVLNPFPFIDINIEGLEFKPLKRIYMADSSFYGTAFNDPNITRTRLMSSNPIHRLKRLRIKITLRDGIVPPTPTEFSHQMTLTVLNIGNEEEIPAWVNQTLIL